MDAKLFARTDTSSQNVPLLLRRERYTREMATRGEKELFELSGVSYVVVKVSPGRTTNCRGRTVTEINHDRVRLDHLLHMTHSLHVLANSKKRKRSPFIQMIEQSLNRQ